MKKEERKIKWTGKRLMPLLKRPNLSEIMDEEIIWVMVGGGGGGG
jgi:hypothetical protein